jgi:hypothetical protein
VLPGVILSVQKFPYCDPSTATALTNNKFLCLARGAPAQLRVDEPQAGSNAAALQTKAVKRRPLHSEWYQSVDH